MSACPHLSLPSEGSFDGVSEKRKGHHLGVVCVCASTNIKRVASSTSCVCVCVEFGVCVSVPEKFVCVCVNVWCVFLCHVICFSIALV